MNITVNYKITHDRLMSAIANFPGAVSAAVKKSAFDLESVAKGHCPVGKTGNLQASIQAVPKQFSATIAPHTDYAGYVEFGTYKMAARSYMRKAVDQIEPQFCAAIEEIVKGL